MSFPNGFRPTSVAGYGISMEEPPAENPNELMYRESTNIANQNQLSKERELEKIRQQLIQEFSVLDNNKDGYVTIDEILHFLESRVSGAF